MTPPMRHQEEYSTHVAVRLLAATGRGVRNRWRQSFVLSVSLVALLGVAAFAIVIGRVVSNQIESQAIARARDTAKQVTSQAPPQLQPVTDPANSAIDTVEQTCRGLPVCP